MGINLRIDGAFIGLALRTLRLRRSNEEPLGQLPLPLKQMSPVRYQEAVGKWDLAEGGAGLTLHGHRLLRSRMCVETLCLKQSPKRGQWLSDKLPYFSRLTLTLVR